MSQEILFRYIWKLVNQITFCLFVLWLLRTLINRQSSRFLQCYWKLSTARMWIHSMENQSTRTVRILEVGVVSCSYQPRQWKSRKTWATRAFMSVLLILSCFVLESSSWIHHPLRQLTGVCCCYSRHRCVMYSCESFHQEVRFWCSRHVLLFFCSRFESLDQELKCNSRDLLSQLN